MIDTMMTYLDYIKKHKDVIGTPKSFILKDEYGDKIMSKLEGLAGNYSHFKEIYNDIPKDKKLYRNDVFNAYGDDYENLYKGFIYTILWGGFGIGQTSSYLETVIKTPKEEIVEKLQHVKTYIDNNDLKSAFNSMYSDRGKNKINGIGISYLTKLLYFLCKYNNPLSKEAIPKNIVLPLIYDRWGKNMHIALLIDSTNIDSSNIEMLFKCKYLSILDKYHGNSQKYSDYEIYEDYLNHMRCVSSKYRKKPGEMEEFLFGYAKDEKNNPDSINPHINPRVFSELYINKYCDFLIDPKKEWSGISEDELTAQTTNKIKKGDKQTESKKKDNKKRNNSEEPSIDINYDNDRENFIKRYPNLNVFDSTKRIPNREVFWGCNLEENLSLYVGRTYDKRIFCSIYRKEGIPQAIIEQLNDLLPKSNKDWIGKYCNYEEAVQTLYQVIDRLKTKKD